ncbi:MAG: FAD/NAD(P)-binding protein [Candidatus Thermoplasmatota archaeon]|nr:FAD/NAD(P)-binding protein [Candidatus Thermoplasmatota archaeon]
MNEKSIYMPRQATIKSVKQMTAREKLFEIALDDGTSLGHKPGQFVELSILGIGEAPISVSSAPSQGNTFELCVRAVGNVTNGLHRLNVGDKVGIRGPFGNGFDANFLKGKDILFVGGGIGIAPLRSLINYVLANRESYGKATILYGCREPCELLFDYEVAEWEKRDDVEHYLTVDKCPDGACWDGNIGVITTIIPKADFDPNTTYAVICGPPIMYKFVIKSLKEKDVPDDHIILSLERRMKCGVGKCGHCQINGIYVCQDGPVFNYADIKNLPEAL